MEEIGQVEEGRGRRMLGCAAERHSRAPAGRSPFSLLILGVIDAREFEGSNFLHASVIRPTT